MNNPCTCGGHCRPGQGCRPLPRYSDSRGFSVTWREIVCGIGLLAFTVYEWHEMCVAGEQCFTWGWF